MTLTILDVDPAQVEAAQSTWGKDAIMFRAYVNTPAVAVYPEDDEPNRTPRIVATLKVSLAPEHEGKCFRVGEKRFRIRSVSSVYNPEMVGENDKHGLYRIVTAVEEAS